MNQRFRQNVISKNHALLAVNFSPQTRMLLTSYSFSGDALADNAYHALYSQGYAHDRILYLSHSGFRDIDGDKGDYQLYIYARDRKDLQSLPRDTVIVQENGQLYFGDFNGDVAIDLKDALLALGLMAGRDLEFFMEAEATDDQRIGVADVIYILQWASGVKQ